MSKSLLYTIFFLFCLGAIVIFYSEDKGLVVKMKIHKNEKEFRNIYYLKKEKFKVVTESRSIIFSEGTISLLDTRKKEYWKGDLSDFNKIMLNNFSNLEIHNYARSNFFTKSLKKNNQEQVIKIVEAISGYNSTNEQNTEILRTPNYSSIAGYVSRKYLIKQNNNVVEEVWIAENLKNYINYELNLDLYKDYMESLLYHTESKLYMHLELFMDVIKNGFPMRIKMYGGNTITVTEVENLSRKNLSDSMFEVSSEYKKVELLDLMN